MARACLNTPPGKYAPVGRVLLTGENGWCDAEVRAYLARPAPSPEKNVVGLIIVLGMGVAAINVAWLLLSQI